MARKKLRVLIVDDSLFMREFLSEAIAADKDLQVVGTAADAYEASDKLIKLKPDVMTLDIEMPKMNGIEFLKKFMPQHPLPVLVVSSASGLVFDAIEAGAVDFINKTDLSSTARRHAFIAELIVKIKIASIARVGRHKKPLAGNNALSGTKRPDQPIIGIGASTGGTEAIYQLLKEMKRDLPGIVIVQHMPPVFTNLYAQRLNNTCPMEVKEAVDGDEILPGRALVAPGDFQMEVLKRGGKFGVRVYKGEKNSGHCPSVDTLFQSMAKVCGQNALGILLTGMGGDGAKGLLEMREKGAMTIGQDEASSVIYGMPKVAWDLGAVKEQLPLDGIPRAIYKWLDGFSKK
ncbi:MAG: protein-glutamate methylesterase/protein-glutamine glutaminase [Christensenellales bacterium]|jgi:two-component system chemotaxis response regulator CheB